MRSAPASKNMFLDCIRKIIPANCAHILQKAFFNHALKRMKHALKALKDNERWVREIALLRKEYEEK